MPSLFPGIKIKCCHKRLVLRNLKVCAHKAIVLYYKTASSFCYMPYIQLVTIAKLIVNVMCHHFKMQCKGTRIIITTMKTIQDIEFTLTSLLSSLRTPPTPKKKNPSKFLKNILCSYKVVVQRCVCKFTSI